MINEQLERYGILAHSGTSLETTLILSARHPRKSEEVIPDELADDRDDDDGNRPSGYTVETSYLDLLARAR